MRQPSHFISFYINHVFVTAIESLNDLAKRNMADMLLRHRLELDVGD